MAWLKRRRSPAAPLAAAAWPWLLGALALVLAPHMGHLPLWLSAAWLAAAGWRARLAMQRRPPPNRWLLLALTLGLSAGLLAHYGTLLGRDAGVALLTAMCAMKLLESDSGRDARVLLMLGYLLLMANLLFSQAIPMVAHLVVTLMLLLAAQIVVQRGPRALDARIALGESVRLLLTALPVMLILFVLFPRIPGPLWRLPDTGRSGLTGLDETMTPGSLDRLIQSDAVAFRVQFAGQPPPARELYWRGPVLWRFDGRSWRAGEESLRSGLPYRPEGPAVRQRITLEPHGRRWLFALDRPGALPRRDAGFTDTFQLRREKNVDQRLYYRTRSYTEYRDALLTAAERSRYLQLPGGIDPRARALATRWRIEYDDPAAIAGAALAYFNRKPFVYTLQPPRLSGEDRIDRFLFETRRGFCEFYAGAFAFLMRAAGLPTRVVLGYQGGEWNGDYLIVRQSDAHAWAEVWLPGRGGWTRVDPTAAIAPQRIEQGLYAALDDPGALPFMARRGADGQWLRDLALAWDAVDNAWNLWVLAYGPERQREFLSGLGFGPVDWRGMTLALTVLLALVSLSGFAALAWRRYRGQDPVARLYGRFCARLARRGLPRRPSEGPLDYAERIARERPELAATARAVCRLYARARFDARDGEAIARLRRRVRALRP